MVTIPSDFILGLCLILVGFVFSMAARPVMIEEVVLGIIVACLAAIAATRPSFEINVLVAIAGLWILIAPALIGYARMAFSRGNDLVVGIVVLILGAINAWYHLRVHTTT